MKAKVLVAVSMGLLLLASILTVSPRAQAADIDQMIASAKTAAVHQAIASYYEQQAAQARNQLAGTRK